MTEKNELNGKPSTRHGLYIARMVTVNFVFLVAATFYSNIMRNQQVRKIETAAIVARAKADALEQQLLEFMDRTSKRWEAFLNVKTIEPRPPGTRDIEQFKPSPTPTATATPKPRRHTVIRYRPAPTPKPFFHW